MTPIDNPCLETARPWPARYNYVNSGQCPNTSPWRKARRSADGTGQCVEVGACRCHGISIRDTKHHASGLLTLHAAEWAGLINTLKSS